MSLEKKVPENSEQTTQPNTDDIFDDDLLLTSKFTPKNKGIVDGINRIEMVKKMVEPFNNSEAKNFKIPYNERTENVYQSIYWKLAGL